MSINLIPLSIMKILGCGEMKSTHMTLILVDHSITYPYGILEDVLVKVNGLVFPADFVILDNLEDDETPISLGKPFLEIGKALLDVKLGELELRFNKDQVVFNVFEATKYPQCYGVSKMLKSLKKKKPRKA